MPDRGRSPLVRVGPGSEGRRSGGGVMGIWRNLVGKLDGWTTWGGGVVSDEAAAFLQGRLLEHQRMLGAGGRTPPWLWLNGVAHGDLRHLEELAVDAGRSASPTSWRTARAK